MSMNRALAVCLLAAFPLAAAPHAQPKTVEDRAVAAKEASMWEMWKRGDAKAFAALLADDFYDVYLSGEVVDKAELLKGFHDSALLDYKLGPIDVVPTSKATRLLVYRAHVRGRVGGKELEYDVDVTSEWRHTNDGWKSVFYRENLVPAKLPWSNLAQ